jgi:hypothetical protein
MKRMFGRLAGMMVASGGSEAAGCGKAGMPVKLLIPWLPRCSELLGSGLRVADAAGE